MSSLDYYWIVVIFVVVSLYLRLVVFLYLRLVVFLDPPIPPLADQLLPAATRILP